MSGLMWPPVTEREIDCGPDRLQCTPPPKQNTLLSLAILNVNFKTFELKLTWKIFVWDPIENEILHLKGLSS